MPWPQFDANHVMVTAAEMTMLEEEIFKSGLPIASLMEAVGQSMANWILHNPDLIRNGALILVGPGHNGGDGLVVARYLHCAGINVKIWCPLQIKKELTLKHFSHVKWLGITEIKYSPDVSEDILWIDAIFGLGQKRALPEFISLILSERSKKKNLKMISLDVPSGICSDSGKPFDGSAAICNFTLSAGLIKQGLMQDSALKYVGKINRIGFSIPRDILLSLQKERRIRVIPEDIDTINWPYISPISGKYKRGRVFVIAGSENYIGSAFLALKGALSSGVGCIYAALPKIMTEQTTYHIPEVIIKGSFQNSNKEEFSFGNMINEIELNKIDSLLIGPGLGNLKENWDTWADPLKRFEGLLVIDADGINQLGLSNEGFTWLTKREGPTWLTPHAAEFSRLFPKINLKNPIFAAKEAAKKSGAGILLKGANTVISSPDGRVWQISNSSPFVARAGWGDVLAGYASGFGAISLASSDGFDHSGLVTAAFMHAEAGRKCEESSSANAILRSLSALTREIQEKNVSL